MKINVSVSPNLCSKGIVWIVQIRLFLSKLCCIEAKYSKSFFIYAYILITVVKLIYDLWPDVSILEHFSIKGRSFEHDTHIQQGSKYYLICFCLDWFSYFMEISIVFEWVASHKKKFKKKHIHWIEYETNIMKCHVGIGSGASFIFFDLHLPIYFLRSSLILRDSLKTSWILDLADTL